jgi:stearoyl-CoA desaturase (delta-9 desaturase)
VSASAALGREMRRDADEARLPLPTQIVMPGGRSIQFNRATLLIRLAMAAVLVGTIFAIWWFAQHGIGAVEIAVLLVMYLVNGLGITVGYHRLFSHQSFRARPFCRAMLGVLGATAMQGPILYWVSIHRKHHRYADSIEDPHTPRPRGNSRFARLAGINHGFIGWMFDGSFCLYPDYVRELRRDPIVCWVDRHYFLWVAAGILLPGLAGWAWYGTFEGYLGCMLAGGPLRLFCHLSATGLVNSVGHAVGRQPISTRDNSRNNPLLNAIIMVGEGLHNNHHAIPRSASFSLRPGEVDIGYVFIRLLQAIGWIDEVQLAVKTDRAR